MGQTIAHQTWAVDRLKSSKYLIPILENLYISPEEFLKEIKEVKINDKRHNERSIVLAQKSTDATKQDQQVVVDLLDTLRANLDHCVGMAANMIGVKKNIIVVAVGPFQFAMINPKITKRSGVFETEEGCLSLDGVRPCKRYKEIEVDYLDQDLKSSTGNILDGQHRSYSMKLIIARGL